MAAAAGEISTDTLVRWRDSDAAFASACAQARARGSSELLDRIRQEAKNGDWRAASWLLERIAPNEYGRRVMVGGVPGSPISIEAEARAGEALRNNPAALRALHDAVAAAGVDAVTNGRTNGKVSSNGTH